jgi:phenylacetate-CoA ligase
VEAVLRRIPEIAEYRAVVTKTSGGALDFLLQVEARPGCDGPLVTERALRAFEEALFFRPEVEIVPPGSLPRFEMKARRFVQEEEQIS